MKLAKTLPLAPWWLGVITDLATRFGAEVLAPHVIEPTYYAKIIEGEIALGTFNYRKHFPNGARLRDWAGGQPMRYGYERVPGHPRRATRREGDSPNVACEFLTMRKLGLDDEVKTK